MLSNLSRVTQLVGHRTEIWDFHFNTCALSTTLFCKLLYDLLSSFKQLSEVGRDQHGFFTDEETEAWTGQSLPQPTGRDTGGAEKSSQLRAPDAGLCTPAGCLPGLETHASPAGGAAQAEGVQPLGCCNTGGIPEPLRAPRSPLATEVRSDKGHLRSQEIPVTRTPPIKAGTMSSPEIAF